MDAILPTEITREVILKASKQDVWNALTEPDQLSQWFCGRWAGEVKPGETVTLDWSSEGYGTCEAIIDEVDPTDRVSYRWHPGEDCSMAAYPLEEATLVAFELFDHADGTRLIMTESGFDRVPLNRRSNALKANTSGWEAELKDLMAFVEKP
ncbi:SRPBCC domain-containing protein [Kamptonema cortianum]|nr:SRPBCC domain-containing protein [Geitlerinema splendidum]MDK3157612.1 SRPBCC domain-containing protein [Kamptonema cortianum]